MENVQVLLEIIFRVESRKQSLKVSDKEKGVPFWYNAYSELDRREKKQLNHHC
jgi:hypothetical protein